MIKAMAIVSVKDHNAGVELRGKLGSPAEYGTRIYGGHEYGAGGDLAGIYQVRTRFGHRTQVRMKFYVPTNPQTVPQQDWRAIFNTGVGLWQDLSEAAKEDYRERAEDLPLTGFNLFMREYLNSKK